MKAVERMEKIKGLTNFSLKLEEHYSLLMPRGRGRPWTRRHVRCHVKGHADRKRLLMGRTGEIIAGEIVLVLDNKTPTVIHVKCLKFVHLQAKGSAIRQLSSM